MIKDIIFQFLLNVDQPTLISLKCINKQILNDINDILSDYHFWTCKETQNQSYQQWINQIREPRHLRFTLTKLEYDYYQCDLDNQYEYDMLNLNERMCYYLYEKYETFILNENCPELTFTAYMSLYHIDDEPHADEPFNHFLPYDSLLPHRHHQKEIECDDYIDIPRRRMIKEELDDELDDIQFQIQKFYL